MTKHDSVVIHYSEIALKGNNRGSFEKLLMDNIARKLRIKGIQRESGQLVLQLKDEEGAEDTLKRIPGIAHFSPAKKTGLDIEELKKAVRDYAKDLEYETFKIDTRRHNKEYKLKSSEINEILGGEIIDAYNKKVKLKNPDLEIKVEISNKDAYISHQTIKGVGGLPTNQKQKIVALLSGGFDSPVASYMMMKRGCEVILVHFQNKNQMMGAVKSKIEDLAKQLSRYQNKTVLHTIPFDAIQKEIILNTQSEVRMLVYRRFMLKIAARIAEKSKARFLVTGDNLSQVSSQTIENLEATYKDSEKPILTPLIGFNKEEIIAISKEIGTYETSAQPYGDCCSYFLPKHPMLKSSAEMLREIEKKFESEKLIEQAMSKEEITEY